MPEVYYERYEICVGRTDNPWLPRNTNFSCPTYYYKDTPLGQASIPAIYFFSFKPIQGKDGTPSFNISLFCCNRNTSQGHTLAFCWQNEVL